MKNIIDLIGNTPIVKLDKIKNEFNLTADIFAKLEMFNPAGSVKDRVALSIIKEAKRKGKIKDGAVIIEATSGNTGIGLALVAPAFNCRAVIVMPDTMSKERRDLIHAYGAEIVLTDGKLGMAGAIQKAEEIAKTTKNSFIASQFTTPSNPSAHYKTTGPEIWRDMAGKIDIFVAGIGTGGTISGVGKYLKMQNPNVQIIGFEPEKSPFLTKGEKGAHNLQGIGAGFIPETLDLSVVDEVLTIKEEDAYNSCRLLSKIEGYLVGITSGACLSCAVEIAKKEENKSKNIVCLFADTGTRYLSTGIFND